MTLAGSGRGPHLAARFPNAALTLRRLDVTSDFGFNSSLDRRDTGRRMIADRRMTERRSDERRDQNMWVASDRRSAERRDGERRAGMDRRMVQDRRYR